MKTFEKFVWYVKTKISDSVSPVMASKTKYADSKALLAAMDLGDIEMTALFFVTEIS